MEKTLTKENGNSSFNSVSYVFRILVKLVAICSTVCGIILGYDGLNDLTYFTYLSNIFITLILILFLFLDVQVFLTKGKINHKTNGLYTVKFMLTISITLTLFIFFFLLAPTYDSYFAAYFRADNGGSFFLHLFTPMLAILDFFLFDYEFDSKRFHAVYAIVPPLCYVAYTVLLAELMAYRWEGRKSPYNFLNYGAATGWFGFNPKAISKDTLGIGVFYSIIVLSLIFLVIGILFLAGKKVIGKYKK